MSVNLAAVSLAPGETQEQERSYPSDGAHGLRMSAVNNGMLRANRDFAVSGAQACTAAHKGNSNFWENHGDKIQRGKCD